MKDDRYLVLLRDMLRDLRARIALVGPGESEEQAGKDLEPAFAPFAQRIAGTDPWLQRWFLRFWQRPITEMLWNEHRGIPIKQGKG